MRENMGGKKPGGPATPHAATQQSNRGPDNNPAVGSMKPFNLQQQQQLQQQNNFNKAQLWQLIEKIGEQFDHVALQALQNPQQNQGLHPKFHTQHAKLKRLIDLRKKCLNAEKSMREKQLALMRERNLYLEKCRQIEEMGEREEWGGVGSQEDEEQQTQEYNDDQKLLQEVYEILYTEK